MGVLFLGEEIMSITTLTSEQLDCFERDGVLVVPNVIDAETIAEVRRAYAERVDDIFARACQLGLITESANTFDEKLTALICTVPQYYQHLDISLPMIADLATEAEEWQQLFGDEWRDKAGFFGDDAVFNLITHPQIVAIAQQLLCDEISFSPVQHTRIKPPQHILPAVAAGDANVARTLWHQDEAVVTEEAKDVPILTVWLAISDATIENGCMVAVRGSHKKPMPGADFGLVKHCPGKIYAGEIYIPDEAIDKDNLMMLEAKAGDMVLLHRRTVHGAGANKSANLRWSFDLRYQPSGTPSGRECFPSFAVSGESAIANGEEYRRLWQQARDDIIDGKVAAVFNHRWNKYADLCA